MDQSLTDSANQLIDDIKTELLDSPDGIFAVDTKKFSIHVLNVVWNLVGSYKFETNDKLLKRNMKCVDKAIEIYGNENLYNLFPFLKTWFPKQVSHAEHLKIHEEIHGFSKVIFGRKFGIFSCLLWLLCTTKSKIDKMCTIFISLRT